LGEMNR